MEVLKGDFIGFTIGNFHSSQLGLLRVSNGDRYEESLSPSFEDKTAEVPGGDGMYYWGTTFTSREFSLQVAFDSVTDKQLQQIKMIMNSKKIMPLVFDEMPYKQYMVKPSEGSTFSYICFDENGHRTYKGEATLNFISYYPFSKSRYGAKTDSQGTKFEGPLKYLEEYRYAHLPEWDGFMPNLEEWAESSRLRNNDIINPKEKDETKQLVIDKFYPKKGSFYVSNRGNYPVDFELTYVENDTSQKIFPIKTIELYNTKTKKVEKQLVFKTKEEDLKYKDKESRHFCINTKANLICGYNSTDEVFTEDIYNRFTNKGEFFKIPAEDDEYVNETTTTQYIIKITLQDGCSFDKNDITIKYDFLYY